MRRIGLNFVLVVFSILFSLFFVEIICRFVGYQPSTYLRKFSHYHPVLGWVKNSNTEGYFQRGNIKIYEKLNSKGLRNPEYNYDKPDTTFRILFLGDSFTEGYDVNEDNLFTTLLEKKFQELGVKTQIINSGTGGYSTDQEYLYYQTEGYKYNPDLVVLMMYPTNDVYYNIKERYGNYYKPLFSIKNDSLILTNTPLPIPPSSEGIKNIFRNLALYQFILTDVLPQMPSFTRFLASIKIISSETASLSAHAGQAPVSFAIFDRNPSTEIERAWQISESLIKATSELAKRNGSDFLLFVIPDRFQIYDKSWLSTQNKYSVNDSLWDRAAPEKRLSEFANDKKIFFVNFLDTLKAPAIQDELYNGVHWNALGNHKAADVLFHSIVAQPVFIKYLKRKEI